MTKAHPLTRLAVATILVAIVALAATLRFWRLDEMEYKGDEQWTYERSMRVPSQEPWPLVGMTSSAALPNPGLSVLLFVALAKAGAVRSPVGLAAGVVTLNVAALALLFLFAWRVVEEPEREAWLWAGALVAVSPFSILLQRKIWAQSVLPLFSMLFLMGWWRRETRWGALLWGFLSACLGQIHMSGFFLATAFVVWDVRAGRHRAETQATDWRWFTAGALVGGIGIAVWIVALVGSAVAWIGGPSAALGVHAGGPLAADVRILGFWPSFWVSWFEDAAGIGLDYSLGPHYLSFLQSPVAFGRHTWVALVATLTSAVLAACVVAPWVLGAIRDLRSASLPERLRADTDTAFALDGAFGLFGLILTVVCVTGVNRHYLVVVYPLQWVWLARLALARPRGRAWLAAMGIAQLAISLSFLTYIHDHQGAPGGDYGRGYRWQQPSTEARR